MPMTEILPLAAQSVLAFWFDEATRPFWFRKDADFDAAIAKQFGAIWQAARVGECGEWRGSTEGRLAEIIVLDQFSRNLCRAGGDAFAQDGMALVLAQEAVARSGYAALEAAQRKFVIMPFMHSESRYIHQLAVPLFQALGDEKTLEFELRHKAIIDRFGRYPHRNRMLSRDSTAEELLFLTQPGSTF